jgi:cation:H+ antiporter
VPPALLILLGLALLVAGGEALVRGATLLARLLGLPAAIIGLTIVAIGTSVPELVVALLAALRGVPDLAVGNVIGSNLFNLTFAIGLSALVLPLSVRGQAIKLEWPVLFVATVACLAFLRDGALDRLEGSVLGAALVAFIAWTVHLARSGITAEERVDLRELVEGLLPPLREWPRAMALALVGLGVLLLFWGGRWVVDGASALAAAVGMSDRVIGLTVVAIGTGLPELVTSLVAAVRRESDIAVANMIGSSIFNLLGILGVGAVIHPIRFDPSLASTDLVWLTAVTFAIWPVLHTGRVVSRVEGALLALGYIAYLLFLLR